MYMEIYPNEMHRKYHLSVINDIHVMYYGQLKWYDLLYNELDKCKDTTFSTEYII